MSSDSPIPPRSLSGQKVLVTGASGYIAWHLLKKIQPLGCEVVRLSRKPGLDRQLDLATAKPAEIAQLLEDVDVVYHFSAQTSTQVAGANPIEDYQQSVLPLLKMLEAARGMRKRPFFVFAGSATEFGIPHANPVREDHACEPVTAYCLHKLIGQQYIELYTRLGWGHGCTLMLANVYGPGPNTQSADRGVLNQMVRKAMRGETLTLYGKGDQMRDYVFVEDVADAFIAAAQHPEAARGRHFIVASGQGTRLAQAFTLVSERVAKKTGTRAAVQRVEPPAGSPAVDARHFVGDIGAIRSALQWKPRFSLEAGIDRTIEIFSGELK